MTWLALTDHTDRRLSLRGLGIDKQDKPLLLDDPNTPLMQGTILFETRIAADQNPKVLFSIKATTPNLRSLTFQTIAGGGISVVQVQGARKTHATLPLRAAEQTEMIRVSYSWDANARSGRLTLEYPGKTMLSTTPVVDPQALSLSDVRGLMLGQGDQVFAEDMYFAALSNQIEPIGPTPTMLPDTPVATPWGYKPLAGLRRGDTVMTHTTGVVPVLHKLTRVVPARGSYSPIRLRAPYFGLQQDIIVSSHQPVLVDGPEVNYLFGENTVLVPARHLINGFSAIAEPCGPMVKYAHLLLPDSETILAAGTAVPSLNIGEITRNRDVLSGSMLHHLDSNSLPLHLAPPQKVLSWHDVIHLARQRAA